MAVVRRHVSLKTASAWARAIAQRLTGLVKRRPGRRDEREAAKRQIVQFMQSAGGHSAAVALTSLASIAWALQRPASELQPLLDELVEERRIFRCRPPLPPDHYSLARWRPDLTPF